MKPWRAALPVLLLSLLGACSPAPERQTSAEVAAIDLNTLPNDDWALSAERIQLSFCRDRINEALLGSQEELRWWRLTGEVSAFPRYRGDGLQALTKLQEEHKVLLWQVSGNVSSQFYHLVYPSHQPEPSVFSAIARINRSKDICYVAIDGIN